MDMPLKLAIDGMHCGACVRRVTDILQKTAGIKLGSVDIGSAEMSFDPNQTTLEEIISAVSSVGFQAHLAE